MASGWGREGKGARQAGGWRRSDDRMNPVKVAIAL
jgi:hypothetical protein